jgi:hypothetical protein
MAKKNDPALVCPIEHVEDDAPVVAHSTDSRYAIAVIVSLFGLVFTLVAGGIMSQGIMRRQWMAIICPGVFLLVGLAADVLAVYLILRCFNPMPVLVFSDRNVYAGSEFEVSWMFRGSSRSIHQLKLTLIGTEKVSYRQGTSTRTEESTFFSEVVFDSEDPDQIAKGFCLVKIPDEGMHSFKSADNEILWVIGMHGSIRRWPDVTETFPVQVLVPPLPS